MDIQFTVTNQNITAERLTTAIGTVNYIWCLFDFETEDWDGTSKYACFQAEGEDQIVAVPLVDNACYAASSVLMDVGSVLVSVVGVISHEDTSGDEPVTVIDYRITSHKLKMAKQKDTLYIGEEPTIATMEDLEAAISVISSYATTATEAKNTAVSAKNDAVSAKNSAETAAGTATAKATLAQSYAEGGTGTRSGEDTNNANYYRGQASNSAASAAGSATTAALSKLDAEAWAVGQRSGVDVGSGDETYHNNSKYYAGQAEDAQEAAETAQGKAEDAQEAAETAQGKAEDAQEAAETAQGKAEDAQEAAETAQDKAEQAAAQSGYMDFVVNNQGHLIYTNVNVNAIDFSLNDSGHLILEEVS